MTSKIDKLIDTAKKRLSDDDYDKLTNLIPNADSLMKSAPQDSGLGGMLDGLGGMLGSKAADMGDLASLASGFSKLDMDTNMLKKFVPIVVGYLQEQGGDEVGSLLAKIMK